MYIKRRKKVIIAKLIYKFTQAFKLNEISVYISMKGQPNQMKIRIITLTAALLIAVTSFIVAFASTPKLKMNENSQVSTAQANVGYYLRAYNSKIGVFASGSDKPQQVLDVYISSFPPDVQKQINAGIYCEDKTELLQRIEDFTN